MSMRVSDLALSVFNKRIGKGETFEECFNRVANHISVGDYAKYKDMFYSAMINQEFLPNSPCLVNAGRKLNQLSACFVLDIEDSIESIFTTLRDTATVHKSGGGTGFNFSKLRPKDSEVASSKGVSSGPISFMRVYNAATEELKQGGVRRGASMGILNVDHPDIFDFIKCKDNESNITNFNLSVGVIPGFMDAVENDTEITQSFTGNKVKAREIFDAVVKQAHKNGEPNFIFLDTINDKNPLKSIEEIEATNPCGEEPLVKDGSCNLGSINLVKCVKLKETKIWDNSPFDPEKIKSNSNYEIDFYMLDTLCSTAVTFLDAMLDVNKYPLEQQKIEGLNTRKIGVGVMGFHDMLILLGIKYSSEEAIQISEVLSKFIWESCNKQSEILGKNLGYYPAYYTNHPDLGLPQRRNGVINTVAPTGTLSMLCDCSSGIEPNFSYVTIRESADMTGTIIHPILEDKLKSIDNTAYDSVINKIKSGLTLREALKCIENKSDFDFNIFEESSDISGSQHVKIQAAWQTYVEASISKTVNLPNSATTEEIADIYKLAYKLGCKGLTIYRDGSRSKQILNKTSKSNENNSSDLDDIKHAYTKRPYRIQGDTFKIKTGCKSLWTTINSLNEKPVELFARMSKSGSCMDAHMQGIGRLVSLCFRNGINPDDIIKQLKGISCPSPVFYNGGVTTSCEDGIAKAIHEFVYDNSLNKELQGNEQCPECGCSVVYESGCMKCQSCGYNKCG